MPKNIEDIIPPEKRKTIRNVPMPSNRKKGADIFVPDVHRIHSPSKTAEARETYKNLLNNRPARGGKVLWLSIGAGLLILLFATLSLFAGGTLAYLPKAVALNFDHETYSAHKTGTSGLLYSVVKLSGDKGVEVTASGEQDVSRKASGTIVVYNSGEQSQNLVEKTRFETSDGKLYRIDKPIVVPAKGSVEATVFADQAGELGNIGLSDFTLPGLKGTAKYTTIYARSKTPISGGFVGKEKMVSEDNLTLAKNNLMKELKDSLISEAKAQVPEDFILLPTLAIVTFEDLPQTNKGTDSATINLRGNLHGVMFKRSDLANYLAGKKTSVSLGDTVDIEILENLTFAFSGTPPVDLLKSNDINLEVNGTAFAVWRTDETALKNDLVGKNKAEVPVILNNYPSIASATTTVRPFWKNSFPNDITHISLKRQPINAAK